MGPYTLLLFAEVLVKSKDLVLGRQTTVWGFLGWNFFSVFFPGHFLDVFSGCIYTIKSLPNWSILGPCVAWGRHISLASFRDCWPDPGVGFSTAAAVVWDGRVPLCALSQVRRLDFYSHWVPDCL